VFLYLTGGETPTTYVDELKVLAKQPVYGEKQGMDYRTLGVGAQILRKLGVRKMQVHLKSPNPLKALAGFDLEIVSTATMPEGVDG
jgi:3,4-dihydroxy 2-butanone 4-phosphate synthase/GTP cyclohydrolase II